MSVCLRNVLPKRSVYFLLLIPLLISCREGVAPRADLILTNGVFFTGDDGQKWAQSVAILGDRILAVGKNEDLTKYRHEGTRIMDMKGRFVCPGFNDAHVQVLNGNLGRADLDLSGVRSMDEWRQMVRDLHRQQSRRAPVPPDVWIVGQGWDQSLMEEEAWPDNKPFRINRIWINRPMVFFRVCGHAALANPKALKIAGINKNTPSPPGGEIVKDPDTGEPTGLLKEAAVDLIVPYLPDPDIKRLGQGARTMLKMAARYGVTSVQGRGCPELYRIFNAFKNMDSLTCRINYWGRLSTDVESIGQLKQISDDLLLRPGLLSESVDGAMGTHGAALLGPYLDAPDDWGIPKYSQDELTRLVLQADDKGYQVALHTVGDAAIRIAIESLTLLGRLHRSDRRRFRLEHCQLVEDSEIDRLKELNVVASVQPAHLLEDIRWVERRLGPERCAHAYPWRDLQEAGIPLALGTYWPVVSMNPMYGLYAAVTRRDTTGYPAEGWYSSQRLTMEEALKAYTAGSAYAERLEDEKGVLSPGKLADLVVLDRNLLEIAPEQILDAKVLMTMVGGRIVYSGQ